MYAPGWRGGESHDETPLRFRSVIEQYVLDRIIGGPQVMRAQLEQLLALMERDNVELHIMPVEVAVHDGLAGDFLLLDFDEARSIGYIEYPTGAIYVQDQFTLPAWAAFVSEAVEDQPSANGVVTVAKIGTDTLVRSLQTDLELRFDEGEWSAFVAGAQDGEFDFSAALTPAPH